MSFTYDIANIATDVIAQIRLATGQTDELNSVSDEVIQFLLDSNNNDIEATKRELLRHLLVEAAQLYDKTTGQTSESLSQIYKQLKDALQDATVGAGAISVPLCMHFGGLAADEFDARNKDNTVFHSFTATDSCPDQPENCGVEHESGTDITIQDCP